MANGTVGVQQAATPDRLIDNALVTVGGQSVYRQRIENIPTRTSTYFAGVSGTVTVPGTAEIVTIACHCTTAGSVTIGGGATIPIPANTSFSDSMPEAPFAGGNLVFTGTDSYYVRTRPVVV